MATFNLTITYPDGQGPRIISALKTNYNVTTNAEAVEQLRQFVVAYVKDVVINVERDAAITAALASILPPDAT